LSSFPTEARAARTPKRFPKNRPPQNQLLPPKLRALFFRQTSDGRTAYIPSRYKIAYGGRGSTKSWGFTGTAAYLAEQMPLRVLCVRELQNSIQESVHKLLSDRIEALGMASSFDVQRQGIYGINGSEFIFAGIRNDPGKIKSTEGVDICLVEEAEKVSEESWRVLIPTIRKPGSELWICFNPREQLDPTYKRFVLNTPPKCRRVKINWDDNPWFPPTLELERQYALQLIRESKDDDERVLLQADYDHVWEGDTQRRSDAAVFRRRVVIEDFGAPPDKTRIHLGADWGFANDPTVLIRFWITEHVDAATGANYQELWVSHEAFGYRVEMDETPKLFDTVPEARKWPIKADCSQPMVISYIARQGFNITAAEKWSGSVEDGIAHVKAFRKIHIHTRCKKLQEEARLYSYKIDRVTNEVLPIVLDAFNHGWDAIRYGLDGYIQRRGVAAQWARLAQ
jgi:phage terminase large subunit